MTNEEKVNVVNKFEEIVQRFADSHNFRYEIQDNLIRINGDVFSRDAMLFYIFGFVDGEIYQAQKLMSSMIDTKGE